MADITWGTPVQFETGATNYVNAIELDANKFVVAFMDGDDGDAGKARVGTVSNGTITLGTVSEFAADLGDGSTGLCASQFYLRVSASKLDTDKFVVVYVNKDDSCNGYARVATVSGTTITWGTAVQFGDNARVTSCAAIDTDKFVVIYNDETDSNTGKAVACTVSGTTITVGTPIELNSGVDYDLGWKSDVCKLDTDKFATIFHGLDAGRIFMVAATVSGTTISMGTVIQISTSDFYSGIQCLDTDKFVIAYRFPNAGVLKAGTVSGTTITLGTGVNYVPSVDGPPNFNAIAKIDTTHFALAYRYASQGNSRFGTVDWSDRSITIGSEEIFSSGLVVLFYRIDHIGSGVVVVGFSDTNDDDAKSGWVVLGNAPFYKINPNIVIS